MKNEINNNSRMHNNIYTIIAVLSLNQKFVSLSKV